MKRFDLVVALLAALPVAASADPPPPAAAPPVATEAAPRISQADLLAKLGKQPAVVVLDVRTPAEFAAGHVPGARNVSHDQIAERLGELGPLRDQEVVLYCRSGRRVALAEDVLRKAGFTKLRHLDGDWLDWEAQKRPVETAPAPAPAASPN
ncbi:MAG TPA: rhodanese-like domain-containing protein [Steroidobacteraceae bacterium]|nr:rhodanese-like domain-containing protein [Steroidobacteraceae bacterium]